MSLYQILDLKPNATQKEIQKSYQRLVLKYHPDKNLQGNQDSEKFHQIQRAFEILMDPQKRKEYDGRIAAYNRMGPMQDEISLDEFQYDEDSGVYSLECRCGGLFWVTNQILENGIYGVECDRCSLCIKLIYDEIV